MMGLLLDCRDCRWLLLLLWLAPVGLAGPAAAEQASLRLTIRLEVADRAVSPLAGGEGGEGDGGLVQTRADADGPSALCLIGPTSARYRLVARRLGPEAQAGEALRLEDGFGRAYRLPLGDMSPPLPAHRSRAGCLRGPVRLDARAATGLLQAIVAHE